MEAAAEKERVAQAAAEDRARAERAQAEAAAAAALAVVATERAAFEAQQVSLRSPNVDFITPKKLCF